MAQRRLAPGCKLSETPLVENYTSSGNIGADESYIFTRDFVDKGQIFRRVFFPDGAACRDGRLDFVEQAGDVAEFYIIYGTLDGSTAGVRHHGNQLGS